MTGRGDAGKLGPVERGDIGDIGTRGWDKETLGRDHGMTEITTEQNASGCCTSAFHTHPNGIHWNPGIQWNPPESVGINLIKMESVGILWNPLESVGFCRIPTDSVGFHRIPAESTRLYGIHWNPTESYEILQNPPYSATYKLQSYLLYT
jgi:hypothetical protein